MIDQKGGVGEGQREKHQEEARADRKRLASDSDQAQEEACANDPKHHRVHARSNSAPGTDDEGAHDPSAAHHR